MMCAGSGSFLIELPAKLLDYFWSFKSNNNQITDRAGSYLCDTLNENCGCVRALLTCRYAHSSVNLFLLPITHLILVCTPLNILLYLGIAPFSWTVRLVHCWAHNKRLKSLLTPLAEVTP